MSWVTVIWSAASAVCVTLAVLHLLVWLQDRRARANLVFALTALCQPGLAACEIGMMRAATPEEFGEWLRWTHLPGFGLIAGTVLFVQWYLGTGRIWLGAATVGIRLITLALNFSFHPNINYREIGPLRQVPLFGEQVSALGSFVPNPWMWLAQFTFVLFLLFTVDASLALWRRGRSGDRRRALIVGGGIVLFVLLATSQVVLTLNGILHLPMIASLPFLFTTAAMGYELSRDIWRAAKLERELREQGEELAQISRVASLGELTASIAHEINQPLGAILSNAEAAEMLLESPNPPLAEVRQILGDIRKDDLRASEVIRQVRALVGRREVQMQPLDLQETLSGVVRLIRGDAQRRGVRIFTDLGTPLPPVRGDRAQLEQVLLNLLLNAMDAMKDTPAARRELWLRAAMEGARSVCVSVEDFGHGVPPEKLGRIFDSFFTTKENGMGLGLALSRSIAEAHRGRIVAENRAEGGAVFRLSLPVLA